MALAAMRQPVNSERTGEGQDAASLVRGMTAELTSRIRDARVFVMQRPAVRGLGTSAGFEMQAMGGSYINDFINKGRVKRVYMQGDAQFRMQPDSIEDWTVRNLSGDMVRVRCWQRRWPASATTCTSRSGC